MAEINQLKMSFKKSKLQYLKYLFIEEFGYFLLTYLELKRCINEIRFENNEKT